MNRIVGSSSSISKQAQIVNPFRIGSKFLRPTRKLKFERPVVALQSDDWGRVGICDRQGWDRLRATGINLGTHPYDFYSLETADDVTALREMLKKHRDSIRRSPCLVMNFITANIDFEKATIPCREIPLRPLSADLPGSWSRPGLFESLRAGIADGVFYPALHGLTHFCSRSVLGLEQREAKAELLQKLWEAETPYIYSRMPWIGYENYTSDGRFLPGHDQMAAIKRAADNFQEAFGFRAFSACAPGYRANCDTHASWARSGIRVAQNGPGHPLLPHFDKHEILHLYRAIDFEPTHSAIDLDRLLREASECFRRGAPLIISIHSINFHSTLKDFRTPTLQMLNVFLSALERRHPDLLYVHDRDLYDIATSGTYRTTEGTYAVATEYAHNAWLQPAGVH